MADRDGMDIARARIAHEAEARTGELDLRNLGLNELPDGLLVGLQHLRVLRLGNIAPWEFEEGFENHGENKFTAVPGDVEALGGLRRLDLAGLDVAELRPVAGLNNLQVLDASRTKITDLTPIAGLGNLQRLDVSRTPVADLAPLAGLDNLLQLYVSGTHVVDLTPLADLRHLELLDVSETDVADLAPLAGLGKLQHLSAFKTKVVDLSPIAALGRLELLNVWETEVADLVPIAGLRELQRLYVFNTKIVDLAPLAGLRNLRELSVYSTQVTDLAPIAGLEHLRRLDVSATNVGDLGPLAALVNLEQLDVAGTNVADLTPLTTLANLKELNAWGTRVADLTPLARLSNLEEINVSNTQIADLTPIARLDSLRGLDVVSTNVRNLAPIAELRNLERLNVSDTRVADLTHLAGLAKLVRLAVSGTRVGDLEPIAGLRNLRLLVARNTRIADLAPIAGLKGLIHVDARNTRVQALPRSIGLLTELEDNAGRGFGGLNLEGCPLEAPLPRLIAPGQPEATRNVLAWLRGELDPESLPALAPEAPPDGDEDPDPPPDLPAQGAGRHIVIDQRARLIPAPPGALDGEGNNLARLRGLHPALTEATRDLVAALSAGNRPHPLLLTRAEAYRAQIDRPLDEVDFPAVFAEGVRIDNAARRARKGIAEGRLDTPDLPLEAEEALDTILQLHPGFIAASRDGTEMLADQVTVQLTAEDLAVLSEVTGTFAADLARRPDLAAPEVPAAMAAAAAEIATSPNPQRDATTTVAMTRNAVIGMGQCAVTGVLVAGAGGVAAITVGGILVPVAVTGAVGVAGYESLKKSKHFEAFRAHLTFRQEDLGERAAEAFLRGLRGHRDLMLRSEPSLRRLARVPGFGWLNRTLDWLKRTHNDPPPH